jgi:NAD(P)H-dependent FMN reductase
MARVLLISGSLRADSLNTRLLRHLAERLSGRCEVDLLLPQQVELPLFDQDLEGDPDVVAQVAALHRRVSNHDALIVASPEYNGQLTPYLKNLVDWVSRLAYVDRRFGPAFCDRPVLLCSASTGSSGGSVAVPHARALFGYVGALVVGDTVCIPHAERAWVAELGFAFDDGQAARIDAALARVLALAHAVSSGAHPAASAVRAA